MDASSECPLTDHLSLAFTVLEHSVLRIGPKYSATGLLHLGLTRDFPEEPVAIQYEDENGMILDEDDVENEVSGILHAPAVAIKHEYMPHVIIVVTDIVCDGLTIRLVYD